MATRPSHPLAPISEALNAWQAWDSNFSAGNARPDLGDVLGIGSANTVFSLDRAPDLVLRVRHNTRTMSLNSPSQEISVWRAAAALGLGPDVLWVGSNDDVVITQRLAFSGVDENAHSQLLKRVHESGITAPRLSLEDIAAEYTRAIKDKNLSHLATNSEIPAIQEDLHRLDSGPSCFCHNDLTLINIGQFEGRHLAIDWEYAALGNRHFDIAVASQHMEKDARDTFAKRTAGNAYDQRQWQAACRIAPLMDHLWTLATFGHKEGVSSKKMLEKRWGLND